jgi:3',5'-cyclic AMP phosphodiesterase CpdA
MAEPTKLTRRELCHLGATGLLAAGMGVGRTAEAAAQEEFHFLVVNDLHLVDHHCAEWLQGVVRQMKAHPEKIELCLVVGDLSDGGSREQLLSARELFRELGIPVYPVPGNHDYLTQEDRTAYEELFPDRINYRFEHRGWQFIGLDTTEGLHFEETHVQPPTFRWLDDTLPRLDRNAPVVLFTHFPLGAGVRMRPVNADEVLARFRDHNLRAVFDGHFHGFTERRAGAATLTTNRCCSFRRGNHDGTKEKGYFLCRAKEGEVTRRFVEVEAP